VSDGAFVTHCEKKQPYGGGEGGIKGKEGTSMCKGLTAVDREDFGGR